MKKLFGNILLAIVVVSTVLLILIFILSPLLASIIFESWYWLLWYCIIVPALGVFGYLNRLETGVPKMENPPAPPTKKE